MKASLMGAGLMMIAMLWGCASPERVEAERPTRVAVLRLTAPPIGEDTAVVLGMHVTAADFSRAATALARERPDIIVIEMPFASTGVPFNVVRDILKIVYREMVPGSRVVGWLGDTYGGAAVAAWGLPELVVKRGSSFGPATLGLGLGSYDTRRVFEEWESVAREAADLSGRPLAPLRSLQVGDPLFGVASVGQQSEKWSSAAIDGSVEFRARGSFSPFTSNEMLRFGFAFGIADELSELTALLNCGTFEIVGLHVDQAVQDGINTRLHADLELRNRYAEYTDIVTKIATSSLPEVVPESLWNLLNLISAIIADNPEIAQTYGLDAEWAADQRMMLRRLPRQVHVR